MQMLGQGSTAKLIRKTGHSQSCWRTCKRSEIIRIIKYMYQDRLDIGLKRKLYYADNFIKKYDTIGLLANEK